MLTAITSITIPTFQPHIDNAILLKRYTLYPLKPLKAKIRRRRENILPMIIIKKSEPHELPRERITQDNSKRTRNIA